MSRSQPNTVNANPSTRWFQWQGENGVIEYYDKDVKENKGKVHCPLPFTFIVLDQLSTIKGWHKSSDSGIFSNEVKNLKEEPLVVKAFKGGEIGNGLYENIKEKVNNAGGDFHSSIYIAYKDGAEFKIGNLSLKGAGVNAWIEFQKKNRAAIDEQAIVITGYEEGTKGKITFRMPVFALKELSASTQEVAIDLDKELQVYLKGYLGKAHKEEEINQDVKTDVVSQEPWTDTGIDKSNPMGVSKEAMGLSKEELLDLPF